MNLHSYEETYSVGNANDTNNDDDDDIDDDGDKEGLLARQELMHLIPLMAISYIRYI